MVGRKRVRFLAVLILFLVVVVVYFRKSQVESYRDYVTEKVVGGGAVMRKPEVQEPAGALPRPTYAPTTRPTPRPTKNALGDLSLTKSAARAEASSNVSPASKAGSKDSTTRNVAPATTPAVAYMPPITDDDLLPEEFGEGRIDNSDVVSTSSTIYWTKQPELYPVSTTMQLPTGSSKPMPRIQYAGKDAGKPDVERLAIIKEATEHAWAGYRDMAFGMDEVKPISGGFNNPFMGWGATLVDSLDTLWIMGMEDAFEEAVEQVRTIDFTTANRMDIPLFETTIRYLGGLVGAYDISGAKYHILLDKAVELAEVLFSTFDTPNRMPVTYYQWRPAFASQGKRASSRIIMAELGSLSLEFTRLAQLTGEPKYYDAIARITDAFEVWQNNTRLPGMWPTYADGSGCDKSAAHNVQGSSRSAAWASRNQQLVAGGTMMEAGLPVRQGAGPNLVSSSGTVMDQKQHLEAQAKLEKQNGAEVLGGASGGTGKAGTAASKSSEKALGELGSSKMKRQLDNTHFLSPPRNATTDDTGVRRAPQDPAQALLTGQEVCISQGLASTSIYSQESFTLGGMSDSTYEYLPKEYMLLGGLVGQYKDMYLYSANTVIENLLLRPMTIDNRDLLMSGLMRVSINHTDGSLIKQQVAEGEHLTCFAGGMFALGGKLFDRPEHVEIGRKLTDGCIWAYNSTTTGIMPESFEAMPCKDMKDCKWNETAYYQVLDPYEASRTVLPKLYESAAAVEALNRIPNTSTISASSSATDSASASVAPQHNGVVDLGTKHVVQKLGVSEDKIEEYAIDLTRAEAQNNQKRQLADEPALPRPMASPSPLNTQSSSSTTPPADGRPTAPPPSFYTPPVPLSHQEFVAKKIEDERLPPGMVHLRSKSYILRPEAIESVFYMYRITGEQYWRDMGWNMFIAIDTHTRSQYGNAGIDDVTKMAPEQKDKMESFWLAETLKYFYLLFDDAETWSLDEWVLNTEAHFFKRPKYQFT
ncbi:hypothetical protein LTR86_006636 [Recurvomyces mirabilis]|nr:hypothetical protein LTR86_006636 [Recurvomyces mirabilis]